MLYSDFEILKKRVRFVGDKILLPYFFNKASYNIYSKNNNDIVSSVDIKIEELLIEEVRSIVDNASFVTEETNSDNMYKKIKGPTWFIDPIDGTKNFVSGNSNFAISLYLDDGDNSCAIIYLPAKQCMISYHKEQGVMCNNSKLKMLDQHKNDINFIDIGNSLISENKYYKIKKTRSCVVNYVNLISSKIDGIVFTSDILPWDHSAGNFILKKINGYSAFIDGEEYSPTPKHKILIAAKNKKTWEKLRKETLKWVKSYNQH